MKCELFTVLILVAAPACAANGEENGGYGEGRKAANLIDDSIAEDPSGGKATALPPAETKRVVIPAAPRAEAEIPVAPLRIPGAGQGEEDVGTTAQALATVGASGWVGGPRQTLYVADGSGGNWLGGYPVTASIYNRYLGNKYWISGPGNFNEEGNDILQTLASRMYWDCRAGRNEAVISGYSRGAYNVLEAHRWAAYWGCAPTVEAALFVDPVDTLIWSYNHFVPDNAPTRILRKNFWTNIWAFVFANGQIYGGQQSVLETPTTHPGFGFELWVADDEVAFGNATLGSGAFR